MVQLFPGFVNVLMLQLPLKPPTVPSHRGFWFLACPLADQDPAPTLRGLGLRCPELVVLFMMDFEVPKRAWGQHSLGQSDQGKQLMSERRYLDTAAFVGVLKLELHPANGKLSNLCVSAESLFRSVNSWEQK